MKIFTKRNILQKTTIAILMVLCINFIIPTYSSADFGGVIASPIVDFVCSVGDVVINLLQRVMTGEWGSEGAGNMSLSLFLMESQQYYNDPAYKGASLSDVADSNKIDPDTEFDKGWLGLKDEYYIPVATYSPEQIFSGNVSGLDINFINPNFKDGSAADLQGTIASWYVALRNLAIVGLLCVLVYVGIRIMLSSTAGDKAKYKQMFTDWLIALCILFFLHYIMSFILTLTESICSAIGGDGEYTISVFDETAGKTFQTNLLGLARFKTQLKDFGQKCTYLLFYIALVVYTAIFTWHYLKRLIMMAFLTIIAPMVALTYPIDKIGDGKAQAFNMWLKEYIYNALIQPFHLIIYTVFVGSAIDLVQVNMLYALACMAFLLPAEKFLKKMFGMDRAPLGTMGALTTFTAGTLASKLLGGKGGGSKLPSKGNEKPSDSKTPRYERTHGTDGIEYAENHQLGIGEGDKNTEAKEDGGKDNALNDRMRRELAGSEETQINDDIRSKALSDEEAEQRRRLGQAIDNQNENEEQQGKSPIVASQISTGTRFARGMNNLVSAHGGKKGIAIKGAKTLGRAAKFVGRTAFTAAGVAAGAGIGLASGQGLTGVVAGAVAGKKVGSRLGKSATELPGNAINGAINVGGGISSSARREIDTFNGNTNLQDKATAKAFMKEASTEQYIRDKWTKDHNGTAPTAEQFKREKEAVQVYANEGMTDVAQIYRARKAENFGVSAEQSAKIALLAQDRKITSDVLGDEKKFNSRREDFTQEFINKGLSEEKAARQADYVLNVMKAQVGQRHNLGKTPSKVSKSSSNVGKTKSLNSSSNNTTTSSSGSSSNRRVRTTTRNSANEKPAGNVRSAPRQSNTRAPKANTAPKGTAGANRKPRTLNRPK